MLLKDGFCEFDLFLTHLIFEEMRREENFSTLCMQVVKMIDSFEKQSFYKEINWYVSIEPEYVNNVFNLWGI
jgi:hypothetical protein